MRFSRLGVILALSTLSAPTIHAAIVDPAAIPVQTLCDRLIVIMKGGKQMGLQGRKATIEPIIDQAFDLPLMTRLSIGATWGSLSPPDQAALVSSFRRMTIAQYAANFDSFNGQKFTLDPRVAVRGGDRLVRSSLVTSGEAPVSIAYRLRQNGSDWKIIDVYYQNAISQLATRRADFARILGSGGAKALIKHLNALAERPNS